MQEYSFLDNVLEISFIFLYVGSLVGCGLQKTGPFLRKKLGISLESKLDKE